MHIDELWLPFRLPLAPAVLEVADELLLLGIDGDLRDAPPDTILSLGVDVLELHVAIGVLRALVRFVGRLQAVAMLAQELRDRLVADANAMRLEQLGRKHVRALARPAVSDVNYSCSRIVSLDLLPKGARCLTRFATRANEGGTMSKVSAQVRRELVQAISERYARARKDEKRRILDEFVALTEYHRKHALRILNAPLVVPPAVAKSVRPRLYDEAVREALTILWEASDRVCGKRLTALVPVVLPALERHGHLQLDASVRARVLSASAATVDRVLAIPRASAGGRRRAARSKPAVRVSIPVRTFGDWKEPVPGFLEVDLVSHCGGNASGSFMHTLVLTDVASGWTECVGLLVREAALIVDAITRLRRAMPFSLRGIDTDNGSQFINDTLLAYCSSNGIEFTRSRPHRKNDQAWVEQKNGSIVRRLVGYGRLEGVGAAESLARLYTASRLFVNFFQTSFKLAEKSRVGARISKRYHPPETPSARLLRREEISDATKEQLRAAALTLDPLRLLDEIRTVQHHLAGLAAGHVVHALPHRDKDLARFLQSLATAWKEGEVRPTHRAGPKPPRHWRTRADPFAPMWSRVLLWLRDRT